MSELTEPDHSLGEVSDRLWSEVTSEEYDWDARMREASALKRMLAERPRGGLDDVIAFYKSTFVTGARILTVSVHSSSKEDQIVN